MRLEASVVVPARDEARTIGPLLDSLLAQTRRPDEVVVCDGGSRDGTAEIAKRYAARGLPVRVVRAGPSLPGGARNAGIRAAAHGVIALTDAGVRLAPDWLERLLAPLGWASPPDVVYGRFEPVVGSLRQRGIALAFVPARERGTGLRTPSVASMAMRRTVWETVGGFRENLRSAEDLLFMRAVKAAGFRAAYAPDAVAHWSPPATYAAAFRRFAAYSRSNIHAGLAREWQLPLLRTYLATALLTASVVWTPLGALAPLVMLAARAGRRVAAEHGPAVALRPATLAATMLALAVIDLGTCAGSVAWLVARIGARARTPRGGRAATRDATAPGDAPAALLYLCYLGIDEPLVETQVVPYLAGLSAAGYRATLLTFEPGRLSAAARRAHGKALRERGVEWRSLQYHKRPALPATLADVAAGIAYGAYLVRTRGIRAVHARGHVPAVMAAALKALLGTRFVFDIRGLLADEYADAGLWARHGLLFRSVKRIEDALLRRADAAIVLTRRARQWLFDVRVGRHGRQVPVEVVPCCVDLERFHVEPARAREVRTRLGLGTGPVMVYAGKLGGVYMTREMVEFFCGARNRLPGLRFLILSQGDTRAVNDLLVRRYVAQDAYRCLRVSPEDLPAHLAAADFAISFRTPGFSQIAASPAKMAEYLAAGLPVVYNAGIGDLDDLEDAGVGVVVTAFDCAEYDRAARDIGALLEDRPAASQRCRAVAARQFSLASVGVPRYRALYAALVGREAPAAAGTAPAGGPRGVSEQETAR